MKIYPRQLGELYISQPAITQRINNLEKQLNIKLFYRKSNGMKLTNDGKQLYYYIKDSIELMNNVENRFEQYLQNDKRNGINLKFTNFIENLFLCNAIIKFSQEYPEISVNLATGTEDEAIDELLNNQVDIIAVRDDNKIDNKELERISIQRLTPCLYTSKEYINKQNNLIDIYNKSKEYNYILPSKKSIERIEFDKLCKKYNLNIQYKYEIESVDIRNYLVSNGFGIALGFKEYIEENLKKKIFVEIQLEEKMPICNINWVTKKNKRKEKNIEKFIEIVKAI